MIKSMSNSAEFLPTPYFYSISLVDPFAIPKSQDLPPKLKLILLKLNPKS